MAAPRSLCGSAGARLLAAPLVALFAAASVAASVSGCGFKLRGSDSSYHLPFHSIYVAIPDTSPLGTELRRNLRAGDAVTVADTAAQAQAEIDLVSENRGRSILSLNSLGRVREYLLTYTVVFRVRDPKGADLLGPTEITLRRNMAFDETQVLAKEAEANLLYRDMQGDAVQQILRRIAALKPPAA